MRSHCGCLNGEAILCRQSHCLDSWTLYMIAPNILQIFYYFWTTPDMLATAKGNSQQDPLTKTLKWRWGEERRRKLASGEVIKMPLDLFNAKPYRFFLHTSSNCIPYFLPERLTAYYIHRYIPSLVLQYKDLWRWVVGSRSTGADFCTPRDCASGIWLLRIDIQVA